MTPVKRSRQDRDGHVELRIPPSTGVFDWKRRCDSGPDSDTLEAPTINDHVGDSQEKQTIIAHEKSPLPCSITTSEAAPSNCAAPWSGADPGEPL